MRKSVHCNLHWKRRILRINKDTFRTFTGKLSKEELRLHNEQLITGDYVLQCCSELTNSLKEREIQNTVVGVKKPQDICDRLASLARNKGVKKDLPIVVTRII
jgi:serine/threonine protein phosphatase PrpC